jgi:hypothetical protein
MIGDGMISPAFARAGQPLPGSSQDDADALDRVLGESLRRFLDDFGALYPEDVESIDCEALRKALETWRDNDSGARKSGDLRGSKQWKERWGDRYTIAAKAIANTSFKTTRGVLKKKHLEQSGTKRGT